MRDIQKSHIVEEAINSRLGERIRVYFTGDEDVSQNSFFKKKKRSQFYVLRLSESIACLLLSYLNSVS